MAETLLLKDQLFNEDTTQIVANALEKEVKGFDKKKFMHEAIEGYKTLELKDRGSLICHMIEEILVGSYQENLDLLDKTLAHYPVNYDSFVLMAYQEYIERNGCKKEYLKQSLEYMAKFTSYFSAEFAIRDFINEFPEETLDFMMACSKSDDYHRRRLASEGLRPKLPWAKKITFDYVSCVQVLDNLYMDSQRYVTRSVANHLNDISKFDGDLVVDVLDRWSRSGKQNRKEMDYIINHALRTLIKKGHEGALKLIGYDPKVQVKLENIHVVNNELALGDYLEFSFDIIGQENGNLMIDYQVDYPMANQKRSKKVFKIKKSKIEEGQRVGISKRHQFKSMTTKKLYTGNYRLSLQINGTLYSGFEFFLQV